MATQRIVKIGLLGGDDALQSRMAQELRGIGQVRVLSGMVAQADLATVEVLLVVLSAPFELGVRSFARCRLLAPKLPAVMLCDGLDLNTTIEIVKLGSTDAFDLTGESDALSRKIERAVLGAAKPAFDSPVLAPLSKGLDELDAQLNRRRGSRAKIPAELGVSAMLTLPTVAARFRVIDFAIASEGNEAGLSLSIEEAAAARLPLKEWGPGTPLPFVLEAEGQFVPIAATVKRIASVKGPSPHVAVGVEYTLRNPDDEQHVQRVWLKAQRKPTAPIGARPNAPIATKIQSPVKTTNRFRR